ncbi:MAG: hypothetical protein Q7S65_01665 [Nanoarchaeota archaeon]|nr:hypothetical protein [Nanoarchaeota archaeon]
MGIVRGAVRGYLDSVGFTRELGNTLVFVKIWIKKDKLDLRKQDDWKKMSKNHPALFKALLSCGEAFRVFQETKEGKFELKLPIGDWGYILGAQAGKEESDILHEKANNGTGKPGPIAGQTLASAGSDGISGIIIPIEDKWIVYAEKKPDQKDYDERGWRPGVRP